MSGFLRLVGRLLFATLLLTSAVVKVNDPAGSASHIEKGYENIQNIHPTLKSITPTTNQVSHHETQISQYRLTAVRVIGAFEALIALMIIFGDGLGGVLLSVAIVISTLANYSAMLLKGQASIKSVLP